MKRFTIFAIYGGLISAVIFSILWYIDTFKYEPLIAALSIFVAITALFIHQWLNENEMREGLLHALGYEIYKNLQIFNDSKFKPQFENESKPILYPRLETSIVEATKTTGVFKRKKDRSLFRQLYLWSEVAVDFNRHLEMTEYLSFLKDDKDLNIALRSKLYGKKSVIIKYKKVLTEFANLFLDNYSKESGIGREKMLVTFDEDELTSS